MSALMLLLWSWIHVVVIVIVTLACFYFAVLVTVLPGISSTNSGDRKNLASRKNGKGLTPGHIAENEQRLQEIRHLHCTSTESKTGGIVNNNFEVESTNNSIQRDANSENIDLDQERGRVTRKDSFKGKPRFGKIEKQHGDVLYRKASKTRQPSLSESRNIVEPVKRTNSRQSSVESASRLDNQKESRSTIIRTDSISRRKSSSTSSDSNGFNKCALSEQKRSNYQTHTDKNLCALSEQKRSNYQTQRSAPEQRQLPAPKIYINKPLAAVAQNGPVNTASPAIVHERSMSCDTDVDIDDVFLENEAILGLSNPTKPRPCSTPSTVEHTSAMGIDIQSYIIDKDTDEPDDEPLLDESNYPSYSTLETVNEVKGVIGVRGRNVVDRSAQRSNRSSESSDVGENGTGRSRGRLQQRTSSIPRFDELHGPATLQRRTSISPERHRNNSNSSIPVLENRPSSRRGSISDEVFLGNSSFICVSSNAVTNSNVIGLSVNRSCSADLFRNYISTQESQNRQVEITSDRGALLNTRSGTRDPWQDGPLHRNLSSPSMSVLDSTKDTSGSRRGSNSSSSTYVIDNTQFTSGSRKGSSSDDRNRSKSPSSIPVFENVPRSRKGSRGSNSDDILERNYALSIAPPNSPADSYSEDNPLLNKYSTVQNRSKSPSSIPVFENLPRSRRGSSSSDIPRSQRGSSSSDIPRSHRGSSSDRNYSSSSASTDSAAHSATVELSHLKINMAPDIRTTQNCGMRPKSYANNSLLHSQRDTWEFNESERTTSIPNEEYEFVESNRPGSEHAPTGTTRGRDFDRTSGGTEPSKVTDEVSHNSSAIRRPDRSRSGTRIPRLVPITQPRTRLPHSSASSTA